MAFRAFGRWLANTFSQKKPETPPPAPPPVKEQPAETDQAARSGYSNRYNKIQQVGHTRAAPSFGAPALIWHMALWPERQSDPLQSRLDLPEAERRLEFERRNGAFIRIVQGFLDKLDSKGRNPKIPKSARERLMLQRVRELDGEDREARKKFPYLYKAVEPETIAFTIWWHDTPEEQEAQQQSNDGEIDSRALRVRVQAQVLTDHATISIFIDAGKPWNRKPFYSSGDADFAGARRRRICEHVENTRTLCEHTKFNDDAGLLPEDRLTDGQREQLHNASRYLYDGIWEEFKAAFQIEFPQILDYSHGPSDQILNARIFADYRGLAISADGLDAGEDESARLATRIKSAGYGRASFARFAAGQNEPNYVLKSYWPFVRRTTRWADEKDFVACGVMNWRALYISALGARKPMRDTLPGRLYGGDGFFAEDESKSRDEEIGGKAWTPETEQSEVPKFEPVRYLMITKGEPHRKQIGRMAERLNSLGTLRLFALKDWAAIKNASSHIRALGQELDGVLGGWLKHRRDISQKFSTLDKELVRCRKSERRIAVHNAAVKFYRFDKKIRIAIDNMRVIRREANIQKREDQVTELLQKENTVAERRLIEIGAKLDDLSETATGGLSYCITRAIQHVSTLDTMLKRIGHGNIETWNSYESFVDRGFRPNYDYIAGVQNRLKALRSRLQAVTESVQTAALVNQTTATRSNTAALRSIATQWKLQRYSVYAIAAGVIVFLVKSIGSWVCKVPLLGELCRLSPF